MTEKKRMITIPHNGPIMPIGGGVYGPITTPYAERESTIGALLLGGYRVNLVEGDEQRELTLAEFRHGEKKAAVEPTAEQKEAAAKAEAKAAEEAELARLLAEEEAQKEAAAKAEAERQTKETQKNQDRGATTRPARGDDTTQK